MKLSLSKIVWASVSTYENPDMDCVYERMKEELDEIWIDSDDYDIDDWLNFDEFKKDLGERMKEKVEEVVDLKTMFAKYDILYENEASFYTPKAYNYEWDSFDIKLDADENWDLHKYWLSELVQKYIDEIRMKSRDWYMSFEPGDIEKVEWDDYCVLRAILTKEWVLEDIREAINWVMQEDLQHIVIDNCENPIYYKYVDWERKELDVSKKIQELERD